MKELSLCHPRFQAAYKVIPGGVNSPVRAFRSVDAEPVFAASGSGPRFRDPDGVEYLDLVMSWGPLILGHAHPAVVSAVTETALKGTSFGMPTEGETRLAEKLVEWVPCFEKVRLVSSGTEATMSALRLARGFTGRNKLIKFEGCYHGHADSFLIKAGSGALTLGHPSSPGVTPGAAADTLIARYNDLQSVEDLLRANKGEVAALIVEPVAGNMGVVLPDPGFLQGLRDLTQAHGTVLIFDEVITGIRLGKGGSQERFGVLPDLATMGKVVGGGLPIGAFGGRAEIMDMLAPLGPVYQAGTLSGNPISVAAGLATMNELERIDGWKILEERANVLFNGLQTLCNERGLPATLNRIGSMGTLFFTEGPVRGFADACKGDDVLFRKFHRGLLERGVYSAPSAYEAAFVSTAHTPADIARILELAREVIQGI